ncbi:MAG TPA: DUF5723 family protein [Longimicrobiales bacterium]
MSPRLRTGALLCALAALGGVIAPAPATAQLPSASTAALGLADNYTAAARGYNAIAWNPANLALSGNPGASLAFFPVRAVAGLGPVNLGDIKSWGGKVVPIDVRNTWFQRIQSSGHEKGDAGADLTIAALQVGPVGFQLSSSLHGTANLTPDAAKLALFGNAPNGQAGSFNLQDSRVNGAWTSTAAVSLAHAFPAGPGAKLSLGVAGKYTIGHVLAYGQDRGSSLTANPIVINLNFPVISTDTSSLFNNGSGLGLDLGAAYEAGKLTLSGALQNVFNSFKWQQSKLTYRPAAAFFNGDSSSAGSFEIEPMSRAPASLVSAVTDLKYKPVVLAGAAYRVNPRFVVDADFHQRLGDGGMQFGPKTQLGAGAEYRILSFIPLRAGVAYVTGGSQFGGGVGLDLGTFSMNASIAHRSDEIGTSTISMVTLISSFPR